MVTTEEDISTRPTEIPKEASSTLSIGACTASSCILTNQPAWYRVGLPLKGVL